MISLADALVLLVAMLVCVPLAQRLGLSAILGYLAAGMVIGPHLLAWIADAEAIATLAELGVVFLLFAIGLELPIGRIVALRRYMFGLGLAQVGITGAAFTAVALAAGLPLTVALLIGLTLAFSSTATVLQLLAERGEITARYGRIAVSVLLLQDLAVVPVLALLPALSGETSALSLIVAETAAKAAVAVALIIVGGRYLLRPALHLVAATRKAEVFVVASLCLALGTGWASAQAGLSMAFGAVLAGMLLAETEFRHQIDSDLAPFRGLLMGLFFVAVGMRIDLPLAATALAPIGALTVALLVAKAAIVIGLARFYGADRATAVKVGLLIAQGGEFAFIILAQAAEQKLVDPALTQRLIAVVALSMAATPLLAKLGHRLGRRLDRGAGKRLGGPDETEGALADHVVVAGFGRVGQTIARLLAAQAVPFVAVDDDIHRVAAGRNAGVSVYFGDAGRLDLLHGLGVERARAVVVTMNNPASVARTVAALRRHHPDLPIIARARDGAHAKELDAAGANAALAETVEASLLLAAATLRRAGVAAEDIDLMVADYRGDNYAKLADIGGSGVAPGPPSTAAGKP